MAAICSRCGEPLMGAVNRCWSCGTTFADPVTAEAPPIRRPPILPQYLDPQFLAAAVEAEADVIEAEICEPGEPPPPAAPIRRRWATSVSLAHWGGLAWPAAKALLAGVAAVTTFFSPWGIPLTLVALLLSATAIHRSQTRLHWTAFTLSLLALILTVARAALLMYQWVYPNVAPPWLPLW